MGATLADPVGFLARPDREAVIISALAPGRSWTVNMQRTWSLCRHLDGEGYGVELLRDCQRRFDRSYGRVVIVDLPALLVLNDGRRDFVQEMIAVAAEFDQATILHIRPDSSSVDWLDVPGGGLIQQYDGLDFERYGYSFFTFRGYRSGLGMPME